MEQESGQPFHTLLRLRADHPGWSSDQLAAEIGRRLDRAVNPAACRKALQRSRDKFAGILIAEVGGSLAAPYADAVHEELIALGLNEYCRPALDPPATP